MSGRSFFLVRFLWAVLVLLSECVWHEHFWTKENSREYGGGVRSILASFDCLKLSLLDLLSGRVQFLKERRFCDEGVPGWKSGLCSSGLHGIAGQRRNVQFGGRLVCLRSQAALAVRHQWHSFLRWPVAR